MTNIDFDGWADYMMDGPLAMAFLDRLVEGAIIVKIKGRSYRAQTAQIGKPSSEPQSGS
jgi:IstB-like ATP binding protein